MPELPEVHTISQDLKKNIIGYQVKSVQISRSYRLPTSVRDGLKKVIGKKILDIDKIAKNIVIKLTENYYLILHLAMTGRILLRELGSKPDEWVKVVFELQKSGKAKLLRFADMRQFGKVFVVNKAGLQKLTEKYGLNTLDTSVTPEKFLKSIKSKKTSVKNVLMDQKLISGIGNIYATEALFTVGINPKLPTQKMTLEMAEKLLKAIQEILQEAIKNRGSTLPDKMYVDIFGKSGSQQNHFKIYLKEKCTRCGGRVEFVKINGRGTYFCPTCQPLTQEVNKQGTLI